MKRNFLIISVHNEERLQNDEDNSFFICSEMENDIRKTKTSKQYKANVTKTYLKERKQSRVNTAKIQSVNTRL